MKITQVVLTCEAGQHTWVRPQGAKGRFPKNCPDHAPPKVEKSPTVTVHCDNGDHDYETTRQPGWNMRKNCPEHGGEDPDHLVASGTGQPDTIWTSRGAYVWLSNDDIRYWKAKFRNDNSIWADRIRRELC